MRNPTRLSCCVVDAINLTDRVVIRLDNVLGDIDCFIDADGDETDDIERACVAIVQWRDDGRWSPVDLEDFEKHELH